MSKWFEKWRGLAISLALSGSSLGHFALVPLFTIFALRYGWRFSYFFIGLIMFVVNITLVFLVIKGDPDDLGHRPYGYQDRGEINGEETQISSVEHLRDLSLTEAMRTRSFWFFLIVMFICGTGDFFVTTHLIPFVTDYGISPTTAGNMLAWYGLMSLAGIMVAGPVSDLIGNKIPIALTFLLRFLILTFGFTHLITAPLTPTLVGKLYGLSHVGLISGFITTVHHSAGGFWAYIGGLIFDQTGSYRLVFTLSAIMALVAVFGTMLIIERRHRAIQ
jgi:predicted MFS family arabinose efflux permease